MSRTHGFALLLVALLVGCRSATTPTPPTAVPAISCPAAASGQSSDGAPVPVSFPAPVVLGGVAPVTTSCAPSTFPVGTTKATCIARDAREQAASCTFPVSVTKVARLLATNFVAFGDSITSGVLATSCPIGGGVSCAVQTFSSQLIQPFDDLRLLYPGIGEESVFAYPRTLRSMLASRYPAQSISIVNEGSPGELIRDGRSRLPDALTKSTPQVLLLQEGANDINQGQPPLATLVSDLRAMVREAHARGMVVFVGTLLPQRPRACRAYDFCDGVADSIPLNAQIRTMVASEGAVLVDLYPLFDGQTATLLGLDGLHPNEAGYQKMADAFLAAMTERLEN